MQILALLISLAAAGTHAAKHAPAPTPAPSFDVKGIAPGISFAEWQQKIGEAKFTCNDETDSTTGVTKSCRLIGPQKCDYIGSQSFCHDEPKYDTFAEKQVLFHYNFHEDELWQIEIYGIFPNAFDSVVSAMQTKYGKATVTTSDIQNRMGAHFQDGTAIWHGANGVIVYTKYMSRLDSPSQLTFYSTAGWAAVSESLQKKAKAAESDM